MLSPLLLELLQYCYNYCYNQCNYYNYCRY